MAQKKTLNQVSRFKSSIHPSALKGVSLSEIEIIKEIEKESFGGGYASSIEKATTEANLIVYLVNCVSWGGDSVDEDTYAFNDLKDAEYCYNSFLQPIGENKETGSLVRVTRPNQIPKYIPSAKNFKGFFMTERYEGDWFVPYFNKEKLLQLGLLEEATALREADIRDLIGTKFESALLKWGMNEFDVFIQSDDEYKSGKISESKKVSFTVHNCWETGLNYYELLGRYPGDVFAAMKPGLRFHSEEIEEEGEWQGWYTDNPDNIEILLNKIGWTCK